MNLFLISILLLYHSLADAEPEIPVRDAGVFQFELTFEYPGDPHFVYDHLTGDISPWWDHTFSGNPYRLYIETRPGGGFYEIFDESGDGALHATVIYAKRGETLRMEGPLGLSGQAVALVCTYLLSPAEQNGTQLTLHVNGSGQIEEGIPDVVKQVDGDNEKVHRIVYGI